MSQLAFSNNGRNIVICVYFFSILLTVVLILRLLAAKMTKRRLFLDDYLVTFAYANTIALGGLAIWASYYGLGHHATELDLEQLNVQFKLLFSSQICWLLGTVCAKLSLLCLYHRLFSSSKHTRKSCVALIMVNICYGIAFFVAFLSNCHPIDYMWNPVPGGGCRTVTNLEYSSVSLNLFLDLTVIIVPMPSLWSLQMPVGKKIFVSIMFSLGFLTIGIMIWRLVATVESVTNPDFSVTLSQIALPALLELWLGVICACMPTLNPLLKAYATPGLERLHSLASMFSKRSHASNSDSSQVEKGQGHGHQTIKPTLLKPRIERTIEFGSIRGYELDELDEAQQPVLGKSKPQWQEWQ